MLGVEGLERQKVSNTFLLVTADNDARKASSYLPQLAPVTRSFMDKACLVNFRFRPSYRENEECHQTWTPSKGMCLEKLSHAKARGNTQQVCGSRQPTQVLTRNPSIHLHLTTGSENPLVMLQPKARNPYDGLPH